MSRPIVVTVCTGSSSESWEPYQPPLPWHSRAGGGAVHSINSGCEQSQRASPLFDDLIGAGEQRLRHVKAERLGGLKVEHQLEFGRQLYGQIGGLCSLKNAI